MSNYESDSIYDWLNSWITIRTKIVLLFEYSTKSIYKVLEEKPLGNLASHIDLLREELIRFLIQEYRYPHEDRPFEEKAEIPEGLSKIKTGYFGSIQNYFNQFVHFILRDEDKSRLALINLSFAQSTLKEMQKFFWDCVQKQGLFIKEHEELCVAEINVMNEIVNVSQYFMEHSPSKYFNKYMVKKWYDANYQKRIDNAKTSLSDLKDYYDISYAEKYYMDGILECYPFVIKDLDITQPESIIQLLYMCAPIIDFDFEYLVILLSNSQNQIKQGLKVNMQSLKDFRIAIDTENEEALSSFSPPLPVDLDKRVLECFSEEYTLLTPISTGYEGVDSVFELLWEYSLYTEHLTSESDLKYLNELQIVLNEKIFSRLSEFKEKISSEHYDELLKLCEATIQGDTFDDVKLNYYYNKLILNIQNL